MPRSSRHKSHKQHKHSLKDAREQSDSEEEVNLKERNAKEKTLINLPRDSSSSEKRKLSQSRDGDKHIFGPGNGDLSGEHGGSKKRKEKVEGPVADRWNGGEVVDKELKGESTELNLDKGSKPKISVDSKSKSSRKHESYSERKSENSGLAVESEEVKKSSNSSSKVEQKWKSEKDLGRKDDHQYKEAKEKEHRSERDKKSQDVKHETKINALPGASIARELENAEKQMHDELRNHELEKDLDNRFRRRRDDSDNKGKYQDDSKGAKDSRASARDDRTRNGRYKDDKHKDDKHRDRHHEDLCREYRNRDDKHRDDFLKDHTGHRSDSKHSRDEKQSPPKRSKPHDHEGDGSPRVDDRGTSYKDNRGKKRSPDGNEDYSDLKSRNTKEHRSMMGKKSTSSSKNGSPADRARSQSRHSDIDSTVNRSRRRSPSPNAHFVKDQCRNSSKLEFKYVDSVAEEKARSSATPSRERFGVPGVSERASVARSVEKLKSKAKTSQEDDNHLAEFSAERSPVSDKQVSPALLNEKSHSSTSIDRRYSNRTNVRRNLDMEETGRRSSGFKDAKSYSGNDVRGSRDRPLEKPADEFSQADGDSVSSSFNRTSHFLSNSSSIPPPSPAFRIGVGSPSVIGSSEDGRGKGNFRYRRNDDFNVGRGQTNAWKGIPNWPSPLPNGFMPFQHGLPPGGFHAMMQQFPAPPLFGTRSSMELNHTGVPYHIPDTDRFSAHMPGWDGSNGVFGDGSHMYGRPDWDQNRHVMNGRGWEVNSELWKGQELPTAHEKDDHLLSASSDDVWVAKQGQRSRNERNRPGFRAESIEVKRSNEIPPAKEPIEALVKHTPERMPESTKKSNDNDAHFCHVYLSKLDISEDLTDPELYKQCMSLFDMNGNSTHDDVTKPSHLEEPREARLKISNTNLSASLFPTIKDTVLQRAMILYKQQGEEMKRKLPVPFCPGSESECNPTNDSEELKAHSASNGGGKLVKVPAPAPAEDITEEPVAAQTMVEEPVAARTMVEPVPARTMLEEPVPAQTIVEEPIPAEMMVEESIPAQMMSEEPVPASDQDKAEESVSASYQEKAEGPVPVPVPDQEKAGEPVLAFDHEKEEEPVLNSDQEKTEDPVPVSHQEREEGPITNSLEVVELVLVPDEEKPKEVVVPTSYHQEKGEAAVNANQEILDDAVEDQSPFQNAASAPKTNETCNEEDIVISSDSKGGNISTSISDEHKKSINGGRDYGPLSSSEVCESIECRSLSRIHHSSESTH